MIAPVFIQESELGWNEATTPRTTPSFNVIAGDVVVVYAATDDGGTTLATPITNSGTAQTWTRQQYVAVASFAVVAIWTATMTVTQSMSVTFSRTGTADFWGGNALLFRGSDGIGATSVDHLGSPDTPTLNLLTTQANSAIVMIVADWNAADGTNSRVYRTGAGAFTEKSFFHQAAKYDIYGGYYANAGAVATYATGLSAPTGMTWSIATVEVKGTSATILGPTLTSHPKYSQVRGRL